MPLALLQKAMSKATCMESRRVTVDSIVLRGPAQQNTHTHTHTHRGKDMTTHSHTFTTQSYEVPPPSRAEHPCGLYGFFML